jgi:hypothetical protein
MLSVACQEMVRESLRVENAPEAGQEAAIVYAGPGLWDFRGPQGVCRKWEKLPWWTRSKRTIEGCGFWDRVFTSLVNIQRLPGVASWLSGLFGGGWNQIDRNRSRWAGSLNRDDTRARLRRSFGDRGSRMSIKMSLDSVRNVKAMAITTFKSNNKSFTFAFSLLFQQLSRGLIRHLYLRVWLVGSAALVDEYVSFKAASDFRLESYRI